MRRIIIDQSGVVYTPCTPVPTFDIASKVGKNSSPALPLAPLPVACSTLICDGHVFRAPRLPFIQVFTSTFTYGHAKQITYYRPGPLTSVTPTDYFRRASAPVGSHHLSEKCFAFSRMAYSGVSGEENTGKDGRRGARKTVPSHDPGGEPPYMSLPPSPLVPKGDKGGGRVGE